MVEQRIIMFHVKHGKVVNMKILNPIELDYIKNDILSLENL